MRRSMLFVPGNSPGMLLSADIHQADAVILDLEDAVAPNQKDAARVLVRRALLGLPYRGVEIIIRINPLGSGFTRDVSPDGAFIAAGTLPPIGRRIHLQIQVSPVRTVFFEGVVRRHKQVPPTLRSVEPAGFGLSFLSPRELFEELVPTSAVPALNCFEVRFTDAAQFRNSWVNELARGGLFLRTERQLPRDAEVRVTLFLEFAGKDFEFVGKVVQAVSAPVHGLAVGFADPTAVRAALGPIAGS